MKKALLHAGLFAAVAPLALGVAMASETQTYTYDALGRLIRVQSSGTVNNGRDITTTFDPAGNRTNYSVTGAGSLPLTLTISDASITEGGNLVFTVTLSQPASGTVTVNYATAEGTANSSNDFYGDSGTLTFAPGETSKTLTRPTIDDNTPEPTETMTMNLSGSVGASISRATGTGTINDNDTVAAANLAISNASIIEGGTLSFTVTRSGNTGIASSATYVTSSGTATSGTDFNAASGTVSFAAGETSKTISVTTIDDAVVEAAETMSVTLSGPGANTAITTATGTGTINDNDSSTPQLLVSDVSAVEGQNLVFTASLTAPLAYNETVFYNTSNGTAVAYSDFSNTFGSVTFNVGETSKTIAVTTIDDTLIESPETFTITFDSGMSKFHVTATGTIIDNDGSSSANLAISNASVTEGGTLSFTVTRSGDTSSAASASYTTSSGTASSGSDFTAASGTVSFAAGETSKTINVSTIDDSTVESAETMMVTLSSPSSGATIVGATGTGTINDNDTAVTTDLSIGNAIVTEGGTLSFTVTRSGNTSIAASANYATASGTATSGSDFTAASGTVSFLAGETSKTINVATIDDSLVESAETMTVVLSSPSANTTITNSSGTGTINDNDMPASLSIADATGEEESSLAFVVTRSGNTANAVTVNYSTSDGTATAGTGDYTATSGTLSFAAGETNKTINVPLPFQNGPRWIENMTITLASPSSGATISSGTATGTIREYGALYVGETKSSPDGRFTLKMQPDGNLVLYWGTTALWAPNKFGSNFMAAMQADGNLVLYRPPTSGGGSATAMWASNTNYYPYAQLKVQNDGNLVIYNSSNSAVWSSNTCCH